jgi:hypothetical protein
MDTQELDITHSAVLLCPHVAVEGSPILFGRRDEPAFPEDSGWQFTCGADTGHGDESPAKFWSVEEVLQKEPSLREHIECAAGTEVIRTSETVAWQVVNHRAKAADSQR